MKYVILILRLSSVMVILTSLFVFVRDNRLDIGFFSMGVLIGILAEVNNISNQLDNLKKDINRS